VTFLVPLALFGWPLVAIACFRRMKPVDACIIVLFGGFMFLPVYSFKIPGVPEFDKNACIALSLLLGDLASGKARGRLRIRSRLDLAVISAVVISPIITSLANGLGLYDGVSNSLRLILIWGIFYRAGRLYFTDAASLRKLTLALVSGGLIYIPFILFEVRMSPQLSRMIYGFFPHDFAQHIRYGGFRPIVFMNHGLVVAFWSAMATAAAFALWRAKEVRSVAGIPIGIACISLLITSLLCKSAGPLVYLLVAIVFFCIRRQSTRSLLIRVLLLGGVLYLWFRINNIIPVSSIESFFARYFDPERMHSLTFRLRQEDPFTAKALMQPLFGWGGYQRGWPIDPETGLIIRVVDSAWLIAFSTFGFLGLISQSIFFGGGPWILAKRISKRRRIGGGLPPLPVDAEILGLIVTFFTIDCLINGTGNPVYLACAGALVSYTSTIKTLENPAFEGESLSGSTQGVAPSSTGKASRKG
jgi:hypothetical protein